MLLIIDCQTHIYVAPSWKQIYVIVLFIYIEKLKVNT